MGAAADHMSDTKDPHPSPWTRRPDEPLSVGPRHLVVLVGTAFLTVVVGWLGALSFGLGRGLSAYQPAMTLQVLSGLWLGGWGVLAGVVSGIIWNSLADVPNWAAFVPGHILYGVVCAAVFRIGGFDPRLPRKRDFWAFVLSAVVLSNVLGTALNVMLLAQVGETWHPVGWWMVLAGAKMCGNGLPCLILGTALLKTLSPLVVGSNVFCRTWWRSPTRPARLIRSFRNQPIMVKLLLGLGVAVLLPMAAVSVETIWSSRAQARQHAETQQQALARTVAAELDVLLSQQWGRLGEAQPLGAAARRLALSAPARSALAEGQRVIVQGPGDEAHPTKSLHFLQGLSRTPPVVREATVPLRRLAEIVVRRAAPKRQWGIQLPTGRIMTCSEDFVLPDPGQEWVSPSGPARYGPGPGGPTMLNAATFSPHGWQIWITRPESEATLDAVSWRMSFTTVTVSLALLISLVVSAYLARTLEHPISRLTQTVRQAGRTGLGVRAVVDREDEIGQLAQAFNQMSEDLAQYVEDLQHATAEKERLAREMEITANLQRRILPTATPALGAYELAALCQPARQVAGDFYDYVPAGDGRTAIVIGDASGKGLSAGFFMAAVRSILRTAVSDNPDPQTVLRKINVPIYRDSVLNEKFMTLFYVLVTPDDPVLRFANAGHLAAIWYRAASDTCEDMDGPGLPLGVDDVNPVVGQQAALEPGDGVLLYTDGVTDAFNPDDEAFGLDRLKEVVRAEHDRSPAEICDAVRRAATDFMRDRAQFDDITLVALKWPG